MDPARGALRAGPFDYRPGDCARRCGFLLRLGYVLFARKLSNALEEIRDAQIVSNGLLDFDSPDGLRFDELSRRTLPVLCFPTWLGGCGHATGFPL